jgi:ABC-type lipoprotein release transport system permease subunit
VQVTAVDRFPASTAALTASMVVLHPADAHALLRMPAGMATDLALWVFHDEEIPAILPDLTGAFPWPVQIETVTEARGRYAGAFSRRAGIAMVMLIPALLALALLTASAPVRFSGRAQEVGLLKALGWGTGDVVRFHLTRAGLAALPAVGAGLLLALAAPALPRFHLLGRLLLGIGSRPPVLYLTPGDRAAICGITALFVLLPYLLATLWSALHSATADPLDLLEGG